jgi:hypothetical protein
MNIRSQLKAYWKTLLWAVFVIGFDAVAAGVLAFAPWTLIVNFLFRLPFGLWQLKSKGQKAQLAVVSSVFLSIVSGLTIGYCVLLENIAVSRARAVSDAVELFKEKTGTYPKSLDALMPDYLPQLPSLKPVLSPPKFKYALTEREPMLYFAPSMWPRPKMYDFKRRTWYTYDGCCSGTQCVCNWVIYSDMPGA